jgi:glucan 1,3-beta-glucosidase
MNPVVLLLLVKQIWQICKSCVISIRLLGLRSIFGSYGQAYNVVRAASGIGQDKGPFISFHEGFEGLANWAGFMTNADRLAMDVHPYVCFTTQSSNPMSSYIQTPCSAWGSQINTSMSAFGMTVAGEFSNAVTDCGKWVNGVNLGARYDGTYQDGNTWPVRGSCNTWTEYQNWSQSQKTATMQFALASMDVLQVRLTHFLHIFILRS